jgi:hypothetical protein
MRQEPLDRVQEREREFGIFNALMDLIRPGEVTAPTDDGSAVAWPRMSHE